MNWKKICSIIFALCVLFAGLMAGGYFIGQAINPPPNVETYQQEIDDLKSNAEKDKNDFNSQKSALESEKDKLIKEKEELNSQIEQLTSTNASQLAQIEQIQQSLSDMTSNRDSLQTQVAENEKTITSLNKQIADLDMQIAQLNNDKLVDKGQIDTLKSQVESLQSLCTQLQKTNDLNRSTISSLNDQIATLTKQLAQLNYETNNYSGTIESLKSRIAELEKSIEYYEEYIAGQEVEDKVVATFEFNGSVYNIQILQKGSIVSVADPQSTDHVIFNYWTVDSEQVTLAEYPVTKNTVFVADITKKYDVKFMVDSQQHEQIQLVVENEFASKPTDPVKQGYDFDGWTLNGNDVVDVTQQKIIGNTTFIAKFTKVHDVKFMYGDSVWVTQHVRNGGYATDVDISNTDHEIFNGWKLNGVIVNVIEQQIVADTTFVADVTYKYDVKFMVDNQQFGEIQIVEQNGYASLPETEPSKDGFIFDYWTINGNDQVNVVTYPIIQDTVFVAKFRNVVNFSDGSWSDIAEISYEISGQKMTSEQVWAKYGWKVGDEKTFELTSAEQVTVVILGFNHDYKSDGSGKAGLSIGMKDCLSKTYAMNSGIDDNTNVGGWDKSEMRTKTLVEYFDLLPSDLQQVIVAVNKKTSNGGGRLSAPVTEITTSSDKLWLLSVAEISSKVGLAASSISYLKNFASTYGAEGEQYEYFKNAIGDANIDNSQKTALVKMLSNGTGSASIWWMRSPRVDTDETFWIIEEEYGATDYEASQSLGVSFNFCI